MVKPQNVFKSHFKDLLLDFQNENDPEEKEKRREGIIEEIKKFMFELDIFSKKELICITSVLPSFKINTGDKKDKIIEKLSDYMNDASSHKESNNICNPNMDVGCPDSSKSCDVSNFDKKQYGFCIPKSEIDERGLESFDFNGHSVCGDAKAVKNFKKFLTENKTQKRKIFGDRKTIDAMKRYQLKQRRIPSLDTEFNRSSFNADSDKTYMTEISSDESSTTDSDQSSIIDSEELKGLKQDLALIGSSELKELKGDLELIDSTKLRRDLNLEDEPRRSARRNNLDLIDFDEPMRRNNTDDLVLIDSTELRKSMRRNNLIDFNEPRRSARRNNLIDFDEPRRSARRNNLIDFDESRRSARRNNLIDFDDESRRQILSRSAEQRRLSPKETQNVNNTISDIIETLENVQLSNQPYSYNNLTNLQKIINGVIGLVN